MLDLLNPHPFFNSCNINILIYLKHYWFTYNVNFLFIISSITC